MRIKLCANNTGCLFCKSLKIMYICIMLSMSKYLEMLAIVMRSTHLYSMETIMVDI